MAGGARGRRRRGGRAGDRVADRRRRRGRLAAGVDGRGRRALGGGAGPRRRSGVPARGELLRGRARGHRPHGRLGRRGRAHGPPADLLGPGRHDPGGAGAAHPLRRHGTAGPPARRRRRPAAARRHRPRRAAPCLLRLGARWRRGACARLALDDVRRPRLAAPGLGVGADAGARRDARAPRRRRGARRRGRDRRGRVRHGARAGVRASPRGGGAGPQRARPREWVARCARPGGAARAAVRRARRVRSRDAACGPGRPGARGAAAPPRPPVRLRWPARLRPLRGGSPPQAG